MKYLFLPLICVGVFSFGQHVNTNDTSGPDKIISVTAILNCSRDDAFEYFSNNSKLEMWLAVKADVDMKVGGKYELFWSPEDPDLTNQSTYGCKVLDLQRPHFFNIEWRGNKDHKHFMNNVRPLTNVSVIFSSLGNGQTQVTLLHTGWRNGEGWEGAYNFFVKAWSGAFKALENLVDQECTPTTSQNLFCYYLKLNDKYNDPAAWTDETMAAINRHSVWLEDLGKRGILLFAGRTLFQPGDKNLFGMAIIKAVDLEEAKKILAPDPAVVNGIQRAEIFPYSMGIRHFNNLN